MKCLPTLSKQPSLTRRKYCPSVYWRLYYGLCKQTAWNLCIRNAPRLWKSGDLSGHSKNEIFIILRPNNTISKNVSIRTAKRKIKCYGLLGKLYEFLSAVSSSSNFIAKDETLHLAFCLAERLLNCTAPVGPFITRRVAFITRLSHITHSARYIRFVQCRKNLCCPETTG
jgi:hypothetical protein